MTTMLKNARRLAPIVVSLLVAGPLITVLTSAAQAPAQPAPARPAAAFTLRGSAVGGVRAVQTGQVLTFSFTETNTMATAAGEDLVLVKMTGAKLAGMPLCVIPSGLAINPDGSRCEPGAVAPGRSASFVITTKVTGVPGQAAAARLCLQGEATGAAGPCRTVSVKIA